LLDDVKWISFHRYGLPPCQCSHDPLNLHDTITVDRHGKSKCMSPETFFSVTNVSHDFFAQ
jgi:hypothetical protein